MGDRAHYVVKEAGAWRRYYSQWGGYSIELDLLAGPEAATRFVCGQRVVDYWMDDDLCVGAALIDRDERRLLWYSNCLGDIAYRAAALGVMARTWPGWRIDWAYDGLGDLLDVLGEDRRQVRAPRSLPVPDDIRTPEEFMAAMPQFHFDPDVYPPGEELPRELPLGPTVLEQADPSEAGSACLVTIAGNGRVRAYMVSGTASGVIEHGTALEERLRTWEPVTSWPYPASSGVHVDVDARTAGVWTTSSLDQILDASLWPGWRWEVWEDRHVDQLNRVGGAIVLPEPDLGDGLRRLTKEFASHQDVDSATRSVSLLLNVVGRLSTEARRQGLEAHTSTDAAFAHRPMDLTGEERARVHAAIAAYRESLAATD